MKRIVLTGATGNIGGAMLSSILKKDVEILAITRSPEKLEVRSKRLNVIKADLSKPSSYAKYLKGIDSAFLLTSGTSDMDKIQIDFIDQCEKNKVPFVLKQSAMGTSPNSLVKMFQKHYQIEEKLKKSEMDYCILRPNSFTQNLLAHSNSVKNQNVIYAPMAEGMLSYIDIADIARSAISILLNTESHKNKTYTLTGPEAITMQEVAAVLSELTGNEIKYIPVSYQQGKEAMFGFGLDEWLVNDLIEIARIGAENKANKVTEDVKKISGRKASSVSETLSKFQFMFR